MATLELLYTYSLVPQTEIMYKHNLSLYRESVHVHYVTVTLSAVLKPGTQTFNILSRINDTIQWGEKILHLDLALDAVAVFCLD